MFAEIQFKGLSASPMFGYAAKLEFFKAKKKLTFKPGLNVLFGPNGCGKTSVLSMLGQTMAASQGGISVVTETHLRDTVEFSLSAKKDAVDSIGLKVAHDGQPVMFIDPRKPVGLIGGQFDDDFMRQGLNDIFATKQASHGQASAARVKEGLATLLGKLEFPKEVAWKISRKNLNDVWAKKLDLVEARLKASIEKGQPTLLLDEPEANFSLQWQARLWKLLGSPDVASRFQVIVATHSVFALNLPQAHYIDMEPGYRESVEQLLKQHFSQ